jgi:hypothetical protein
MSGAINVGIDQRDFCLELKMRITASLSWIREERDLRLPLSSREGLDFVVVLFQRLFSL